METVDPELGQVEWGLHEAFLHDTVNLFRLANAAQVEKQFVVPGG
jgi:hypothetical protein